MNEGLGRYLVKNVPTEGGSEGESCRRSFFKFLLSGTAEEKRGRLESEGVSFSRYL